MVLTGQSGSSRGSNISKVSRVRSSQPWKEAGEERGNAEGTANAKALRLEPAWAVPGTEGGPGWLGQVRAESARQEC